MKKMILVALFLLVATITYASHSLNRDDEGREGIIIEKETGSSEHERSLDNLECFIYRESHMLVVNYYGISISCVSIYDYECNLVERQYGMFENGEIILSLPAICGYYQIVIETNESRFTGHFENY